MKKRKLKKSFLIFILFVLTLFSLLVIGYFKNLNGDKPNIKLPIKDIIEPEEKIKTYNLSLAATGDALLHMDVIRDGKQPDGTYDFKHQLTHIKEKLKDYDLAYYNQETPFAGDDIPYSGYPRFNSPSAYGDAMIDAGFNMVSLATNHTIDKGESGVLNFYNYWKKKEGIMYHGIADSEESRNQYIIQEKNNITYSMLSYTTSTNGLPIPQGKDYLVNVYDKEKVKKDVEYLRDKVDVLIVAMHWGVEYTHTPTQEELEIANYLAELDVDIVLGAHPHCIQPIDIIDDTVVYYSLGNFISNQGDIVNSKGLKVIIGMLGTLNITKTVDGDNTTIEINNVGADLLYTYDQSNKNYQVIPFSMMNDNTYLKNYESVYEEYKSISTKLNENILIAPLGSN
ncbi:MAG: CapA family protein [Bacilli bacterium]|nr:CapA family protein [Bacilli bacterium]